MFIGSTQSPEGITPWGKVYAEFLEVFDQDSERTAAGAVRVGDTVPLAIRGEALQLFEPDGDRRRLD